MLYNIFSKYLNEYIFNLLIQYILLLIYSIIYLYHNYMISNNAIYIKLLSNEVLFSILEVTWILLHNIKHSVFIHWRTFADDRTARPYSIDLAGSDRRSEHSFVPVATLAS